MKNILIITLLTMVLTACGGGDSDTNSSNNFKEVMYTLSETDGVSCPNADDFSTFQTDTYISVDCRWFCANYKGQSGVYVSLDFEATARSGGLWSLDNEFISSGICD